MTTHVHWTEAGVARSARWQSERGTAAPAAVIPTDDRISADKAYGLACQGVGLLWRSDFQNARQLLVALAARADRKAGDLAADFNRVRQARAQRARTLGMLLIEVDADYRIALRRAPDVRQACREAYGPANGSMVLSLRELMGVISAHQWRLRGLDIPAAGGRIHPHYGVFAPTRSEYVDLVAQAALPRPSHEIGTAFDLGSGTGVLAAVLARRGISRVIATDSDPRAQACARDNIDRLGLTRQVEIRAGELFPNERAGLIVCNPPWIPARPMTALERGVYDPDSQMLRAFLGGLAAHLSPEGEGWLILSDLAEHLGLRSREMLLGWIDAAGLVIQGREEAPARHPRSADPGDALHGARRAEITSLWRLRAKT